MRYLLALLVTIPAIAIALLLRTRFPDLHLELLLLSCAVVASALWGRGPGAVTALMVALGYDWYFIPPYRSLRVEPSYIASLVLFLLIALAVGQLAARLRREARSSQREALRARVTAALARELSGALTAEQILEAARVGFQTALGQTPAFTVGNPDPAAAPPGAIQIPLRAPRKVRGHLSLPSCPTQGSDLELAETMASLVALSLERVHFLDVAREAMIRMEGEKMRGHVLSTLSHDLRTPLTGIVAGSQSLETELRRCGHLAEADRAADILDESRRMADLVENLLDLSRLQSGGVQMRCDWNDAEELFASALRHRGNVLEGRAVTLRIAPGTGLFWCDGLLVERVLVNLLDNAARHTPPNTPLVLWAEKNGNRVEIGLDDEGPGFETERASTDAGRGGIGLSLCRAIAKAHAGELLATRRPEGGSRVRLAIPADIPPPADPIET
ncbi:MAG: DUF4118 domain-containing protein [Fibrobacterota bacterium]|nr:DUF4118 domain-containing protein [Fibrobacterota bacterium]QQS05784.1 MAG: DUF4118 domain-containing protein [Fibrobacterota bacterium]